MKTVLIVEDEEDIVEILTHILKENGFGVIVAERLSEMWKMIPEKKPDTILLDIGLPDGSGMDAIKKIKESYPEVSLLMVTARRSDMDKILGLELGADDYITKPFNGYELLARIKAVSRRHNSEIKKVNIFKYRNKSINIDSYTAVDENGNEIEFTGKEFNLLKLFISHPREVFTRDEILDLIWGEDFYGEYRTVDSHVSRIRKKLGNEIIKTVRGIGYKLGNINGDK